MKPSEHDDFYCREILSGKLRIDPLIDTEHVFAYHHTKPYWEEHIVIIPRNHISSMSSFPLENQALCADLFKAIKEVSSMLETKYGGCRISSNVGDFQSTKHLHFYVHAGKRLRAENGDPIT